MERFVDIHTHILPGLDDGARDLEQAMALLRMAWEDGTGTVVLTPHHRGRYRKNTPQQLQEAFASLRERAAAELPEMVLYLGSEAGMELELGEKLEQGSVLSLNGGAYVLLEFHHNVTHRRVIEGVLELLNCGYTPIIAHAERYDAFCQNRHLAGEVIRLGAMIQMNAGSLFGESGLMTKLCCKRMLRRGQVHFVASDAHDTEARTPVLSECYRKICRRYGEEYAALLFWQNAEAMLQDK